MEYNDQNATPSLVVLWENGSFTKILETDMPEGGVIRHQDQVYEFKSEQEIPDQNGEVIEGTFPLYTQVKLGEFW